MPSDAQSILETRRNELLHHELYQSVQTVENLRCFMCEHVFAVWDFMSLLKRLQQIVTCCEVPWLPSADASLARFINEIVLGEECDEDGTGGYASHFELYLSAMDEIGADSRPIRAFVKKLENRVPLATALAEAEILPSTREFVRTTIQLATIGQPHEVAAAFFYGREDIIPDMFTRLVESLPQQGVSVGRLEHYLRRHIELDGDDHGPLAEKLVTRLSADRPSKKDEVTAVATQAISQRIALWDGILAEIRRSQ
ncbi:DUF3050 domain-containing protein [Schlesneria sp. T3-172]|uniref:DUF3050 domain-containing protein n=1 Tax=Schlesneria sphaerica TaxID=3373610 RepID=UPI0037CB7E86